MTLDVFFWQTQCQPHITEAAKSSVEGICRKMHTLSCEYAQKVREKNSDILREAGIPEDPSRSDQVPQQRKVRKGMKEKGRNHSFNRVCRITA